MKRAIRVAGLLLALGSAALAGSKPPKRVRVYEENVKFYLRLAGLGHMHPIFTQRNHPKFCAWVTNDLPGFALAEDQVVFGLSYPDPECNHVNPAKLALHEVCHVRMHHLDPHVSAALTLEQKHYEVQKCMGWYEQRREDLPSVSGR